MSNRIEPGIQIGDRNGENTKPSSEQLGRIVFNAERNRRDGQYEEASSIIHITLEQFTPEELTSFDEIDTQLQTRFLMALRIITDAQLSQVRSLESGEQAAQKLLDIKAKLLKKYYTQFAIYRASQKIDTDTEGNPYDFDVEMTRDAAKYYILAYELTGYAKFYELAVELLDDAKSQAKNDSMKHLAHFEKQLIMNRYGNSDTFTLLEEAYKNAIQYNPENSERNISILCKFIALAEKLHENNAVTEAFDSLKTYSNNEDQKLVEFILKNERSKVQSLENRIKTWREYHHAKGPLDFDLHT